MTDTRLTVMRNVSPPILGPFCGRTCFRRSV